MTLPKNSKNSKDFKHLWFRENLTKKKLLTSILKIFHLWKTGSNFIPSCYWTKVKHWLVYQKKPERPIGKELSYHLFMTGKWLISQFTIPSEKVKYRFLRLYREFRQCSVTVTDGNTSRTKIVKNASKISSKKNRLIQNMFDP